MLILPPVLRLKHVPIRPRRTRVYAGTIPARVGGPGVDFFGVRDYQPGDPPRRINWHVSARQVDGAVLQRVRAGARRGRGSSSSMGASAPTCSAAVTPSLTIPCWLPPRSPMRLLSQGNRLGLLVYGKYLHWTLPAYGKLQREKILHALAEARSGGSDIFASLAPPADAPLPGQLADRGRHPARAG